MSRKRRIVIDSICLVVILAFAGAFFWHAHHVTGPYLKNGACAPGYVNYGIPLGCITKRQYEDCQKTACPICLSSGTKIDTDQGRKRVTALRPGDLVWSRDGTGQKVLVPILKATKRAVPQGTQLLRVRLQDGRSLLVSPDHPTASGRLFKDVKVGSDLDQATVTQVSKVSYNDGYTYDILPQSSSGGYWADGIFVGSTLKQ